jgi:hypothetical protein
VVAFDHLAEAFDSGGQYNFKISYSCLELGLVGVADVLMRQLVPVGVYLRLRGGLGQPSTFFVAIHDDGNLL